MRKIYLAFFAATSLCAISQKKDYCASYQVLKSNLDANPALKASYQAHQQQLKSLDSTAYLNHYAGKTASTIYTVPVVFHILHTGGPENISDAQCIDAINVMNRDYRKLNADTAAVEAPFKPLIADIKFEFRLATKDTNGVCTSGIIHHWDEDTWWDGNANRFKYTWNSTKYLNIYVVKGFLGGLTWAAAYSSFPGTNPNKQDVVVSLNTYVGSIGSSNAYNSRTLTHEVGHWFDLHHVWGDTGCGTTCGDDGVADTPVTKGWNFCPGSPTAVCTPSITENYQNYMEYSYCTHMFSNGQAARMTTAINSTVSGRSNLWTNANLIATGVINPAGTCTPIADFYANLNDYTICAGMPLNFTDFSYNATINAWNWSATGGASLTAPSASATSIVFSATGTQTVTLMVSNNTGSSSISRTVIVIPAAANITGSYAESFEGGGLPPNFSVINYDQDVTWQQTSQGAASGNLSYYINGAAEPPAANPDILETPSYDFTDINAVYTFKYAYAKSSNSNTDIFKVQGSSDCGGTWTDIYWPTNTALASGSGGVSNIPFIPSASDFKTYTLTDHPNFVNFAGLPNVKLRFYFKEDSLAGYGNNLFLDDLNFSSSIIGLHELEKSFGFKMFPNPTHSSASISFMLSDPAEIKLSVCDISGRVVEKERIFESSTGSSSYAVNGDSKLQPGIYFVNVSVNGQKFTRKLLIE
jgi:hypothetical protein